MTALRCDNPPVAISIPRDGLCRNRHNPRLFFRDSSAGYDSARHPAARRVNPAVGDAQRLRDFRPNGCAGAPEPFDARARDAGAERPDCGHRSRNLLRFLAIETTTPERLCPGVSR